MTEEKQTDDDGSLEPLMTSTELKKYLNISDSLLRKLLDNNSIPFVRVGRNFRYRKSEIDQWVDKNAGR